MGSYSFNPHTRFLEHLAEWTVGLHRSNGILSWASTMLTPWPVTQLGIDLLTSRLLDKRLTDWATEPLNSPTEPLSHLEERVCWPPMAISWHEIWNLNPTTSPVMNLSYFQLASLYSQHWHGSTLGWWQPPQKRHTTKNFWPSRPFSIDFSSNFTPGSKKKLPPLIYTVQVQYDHDDHDDDHDPTL